MNCTERLHPATGFNETKYNLIYKYLYLFYATIASNTRIANLNIICILPKVFVLIIILIRPLQNDELGRLIMTIRKADCQNIFFSRGIKIGRCKLFIHIYPLFRFCPAVHVLVSPFSGQVY